jgi:hypothetical protein
VSKILGLLRVIADPQTRWETIAPALDALTLDEVIELDQRLVLTAEDRREDAPPTLRRRVVNALLARKLEAFIYECFDPFVNPWQLEARMKLLFWRIEFVRTLADYLEAVAEANKHDPAIPWTVSGNLFGMANSALLAWHLGGWDDTVSGYGQGECPEMLSFAAALPSVRGGEPRWSR